MQNGVQMEKKTIQNLGKELYTDPRHDNCDTFTISKLISSLWASIWGNLKSMQMRGY